MKNKSVLLTRTALIIGVLLCTTLLIPLKSATAVATPPSINAQGATLIDVTTGQTLYSKNGDKQFEPASTTKVMTAILVLEHTKLDDKVTIGKNAVLAEGSAIGLRTGEVYTVEELLRGLLLMSGNDCAVALAEHVSGSVDEFSKLMNAKAKSLGSKNTNFKNPSGLPDSEHLTTPNDLALIMKEALNYPDFIRISRINTTELSPSTIDGNKLWLANHNYLINKNSKYFYPYALSGKNGFTIEARHTFAIAAEKDGHKLVATFLKADDKNQNYSDMASLFEYGFNNFSLSKLYSKGELIETLELEDGVKIPLLASKDIYYTYSKDQKDTSKNLTYEKPNLLRKDISKDDVVATADVVLNGETISYLDLVSGDSRDFSGTLALKYYLLDNKFILGFGMLIALVFVLFVGNLVNRKRKQKLSKEKYDRLINRKKV